MVRVQHGRTAGTHDVMSSEAKANHYDDFLTKQQEMSCFQFLILVAHNYVPSQT